MPEYDNTAIDTTMTKLLNKGYSEDEVVEYIKTYKHEYLLDDLSVPENGKGRGGLFAPKKLEALKKIPRKMGLGDLPIHERAGKGTAASFADSWTGALSTYANIVDPRDILTPGKMLTDASRRQKENVTELLNIKDVYERELAENPPEGGLEHFVEVGAYVAGKISDFRIFSVIMAPIKSIQGLKYLKKYPRFAKFFAESQHTGAVFAGVESKHGPEAAVQGYLAGQVLHVAQLPKSPAVKAVTLGLTGKLTAMLQGATPDQSNAQAVLFMIYPLIDAMSKQRVTPKEYSKGKAEVLRIAHDAGIPKENTLAVFKEVEAVSRGNLTKGMADYLH